MTPFYLLSGAGNDFIALAEPGLRPAAEQIRAWCLRGVGIGADGLLVVERTDTAPRRDEPPRLRLDYFNSDGGRADLCINGTRCAARLADHLGWASGRCTLETGVGPLSATANGENLYEVEVPPPSAAAEKLTLTVRQKEVDGWSVAVGVPHFVVLADTLPGDEFTEVARRLRHHPGLGSEGANVDFAASHDQGFEIRSFERGVEAETLACGTGALAVAAAAVGHHRLELPLRVRTRGGFTLEVCGRGSHGSIDAWSLAGDARVVAAGEILAGAVP